jgi:hypothetical protein
MHDKYFVYEASTMLQRVARTRLNASFLDELTGTTWKSTALDVINERPSDVPCRPLRGAGGRVADASLQQHKLASFESFGSVKTRAYWCCSLQQRESSG